MQRKRRTLLAGAVAAVVAGGVAGGNAFHATATPVSAAALPAAPAAATSVPPTRPVTGHTARPAAPPAAVADPVHAGELTGHLLQRVLAVLARLVALITHALADPPH